MRDTQAFYLTYILTFFLTHADARSDKYLRNEPIFTWAWARSLSLSFSRRKLIKSDHAVSTTMFHAVIYLLLRGGNVNVCRLSWFLAIPLCSRGFLIWHVVNMFFFFFFFFFLVFFNVLYVFLQYTLIWCNLQVPPDPLQSYPRRIGKQLAEMTASSHFRFLHQECRQLNFGRVVRSDLRIEVQATKTRDLEEILRAVGAKNGCLRSLLIDVNC